MSFRSLGCPLPLFPSPINASELVPDYCLTSINPFALWFPLFIALFRRKEVLSLVVCFPPVICSYSRFVRVRDLCTRPDPVPVGENGFVKSGLGRNAVCDLTFSVSPTIRRPFERNRFWDSNAATGCGTTILCPLDSRSGTTVVLTTTGSWERERAFTTFCNRRHRS
jgi:hypothetical protein